MDTKEAASLRNTPALIKKVESTQTELIKRFQAVVSHAAIEKTDRNTTAHSQFQVQVETSNLIRAAEDLQTLIRHLQEMWLFGQLNTVGESEVQQQTDENAKTVAALLKQLAEKQGGLGSVDGHVEGGDHTMMDRDS